MKALSICSSAAINSPIRARVQLWQPFIAPSLTQLHRRQPCDQPKLRDHSPRLSDSLRFIVKPAKDADAQDLQVAEQVLQVAQQSSLLEDPLTPLQKPEFAFVYRYTSAGHPHTHQIHDWEVQEAYRQFKRRYADAALDQLKHVYGQTIPARNLHFIMGTMAAHPRTFIVIGLLRSGLDPEELSKQGKLF